MNGAPLDRTSQTSLRFAALVALWIGAAGTLALMLRAGGRSRPLILVPLFTAWDLSPFALLLLADRFSNRWQAATRSALYYVSIAVTIASLAYYVADVFWPRKAQPAFPYVMAPPVAWAFIAIVMAAVALSSRK
jgi:hypothetical protein